MRQRIVMTKSGQIRPMETDDLRAVADLQDEVERLRAERDIYGLALASIATLTTSLAAIKHFAKTEIARGLEQRKSPSKTIIAESSPVGSQGSFDE